MPTAHDPDSARIAPHATLIDPAGVLLETQPIQFSVRAELNAACRVGSDSAAPGAAKRTDWAGTALESAAGDLDDAHGGEGNDLTSLAEVVLEEAACVSHLAEDIESRRPVPEDGEPGDEV
jgi:hypothetical protein